MVAGLAFKLLVGKRIDPQLRMVSALTQPPSRFVSMMSPEDCRDFMAATEIAVAATPKGKLADLKEQFFIFGVRLLNLLSG
jgi:hypothetical protein